MFRGRVGIVQRVLTPYRVPLFEQLASRCQDGLSVASGRPRAAESLEVAESIAGVTTHTLENRHYGRGVWYFCWQSGLVSWLRAWNPDVLIVEANPRYVSTPVAISWMQRRGRKVLGWGLGTQPVTHGLYRLRRLLRPGFLRMFDGLIAYGTRAAEEYAAAGMARERIYVAHNASQSRPRGSPVRHARDADTRPRVLFVGRLTPTKRVDLLIRACAALPAPVRPTLTIVGEGEERPRLEALARAEYPDAEFVGGRRGAELAAYWEGADLFALPGQGGLAIQEAMTHGLPVIVGEADGTHLDLVRPGNGWVVAPGDLSALTASLADGLSDLARLRRMGQESRRIADEEINLEAMVRRMTETLCAIAPVGPRVHA